MLVTGAAGFAGRWLSDACARAGDEVFGLGLGANDGRTDRWICCDITDAPALDAVVARVRPAITYHLAAVAAPAMANADQGRAWRVNLFGTLNLLDSLSRHAAGSRFLLVSSAAVYGSVQRSACPLPEGHPAAPADCYGATKLAAEIAALGVPGAALRVFVARPFNHLGPGQNADFLPGKLAQALIAIASGQAPPQLSLGPLGDWRDFTDVRDVVRAYRAIVNTGHHGRIYNVCMGQSVSMAELVSRFCDRAGVAVDITSGASRPGSALPYLQGDPSRLIHECGWRPEIDLDQSIADALARARSDQ